jgi:dipeptidyl-peptidase 4
VKWMELEQPSWLDREYYLARVGWWPDGSVMAQVENREQTVLVLLRLDPSTGTR